MSAFWKGFTKQANLPQPTAMNHVKPQMGGTAMPNWKPSNTGAAFMKPIVKAAPPTGAAMKVTSTIAKGLGRMH